MTGKHLHAKTGNVIPYVTDNLSDAFAHAFVVAAETGHEIEIYFQPNNGPHGAYVAADVGEGPFGDWLGIACPDDLEKARRGFSTEVTSEEVGISPEKSNYRRDLR